MAPERVRFIRQATFVLVILAVTATEIAAGEGRPLWTSLARTALGASLATLGGWFVASPKDAHRGPPRWVLLLLVILAVAPFILEPWRRRLLDDGWPLELQMVFALRNVGLGLAACACWMLCLRLACVVSLFLMLFAVSLTSHPAVLILLGLYSATGSVWLMAVYWTGLERFFVASTVALEVQPGRERLPWVAAFVVVGLVGCVLGLAAVGPKRVVGVLGKWLSTSGGTGDFDPFARGGVNDGDDEVQGDNARSTGMMQPDSALDSPLPSLYDLFNDLYGEPFKPQEREQTIALDRQTKGKESKKRPADNLRPNREFATARKSPRRPRDPSDRAARALFEVQGRTPLHLRVAVFETYDGTAWQEAARNLHSYFPEKESHSCWMKAHAPRPAAIFAPAESHQVKITRSTGTLVPVPPYLTRFRVGRVDQPRFFVWGPDGVLRMAKRTAPAGTVVETESCPVDDRLLNGVSFQQGKRLHDVALPQNLNAQVTALAQRWAGQQPPGWPQIEAIVQHLRTEYTLDPASRVPADCRDPLGHFLLESRRGPDYQFATAAVVLLRVLGYPTRVATGFYAAPDEYDPLNGHTPVVPENLHFWAEVRLPGGDWLIIEPTPGYEVLRPDQPLLERITAALIAAVSWIAAHLVPLSLSLLAAGALWLRRREWCDTLVAAWWRWFPGRTWQQCVRRALRLLELRGRWCGRPRRPTETVASWLLSNLRELDGRPGAVEQLTLIADWAAYAADLEPPWQQTEVRNVCRRLVDDWNLRRWRQAVSAGALCGV